MTEPARKIATAEEAEIEINRIVDRIVGGEGVDGSEALRLAEQWPDDLSVEGVKEQIRVARQAAAERVKPVAVEPLPKPVEPLPVDSTPSVAPSVGVDLRLSSALKNAKPLVEKPLPQVLLDIAMGRPRSDPDPVAPALQPPPDESEDEEEPEVKEAAFAPAPDEGVGSFAGDEEDQDVNPPTLRYKSPQDNTRAFARRRLFQEGFLATRFWHGEFWRWNGLGYEEMAEQTIRDMVWDFLGKAFVKVKIKVQGDEQWVSSKFDANPGHVTALIDALKSGVGIPVGWYPPMWLDTREKANEVIVFQNGVLDIRTRELLKPSPRLWVQGAVEYGWDPSARCPTFDRFLGEIYPADPEAWQAINEMNGVCMTQDVRFQKGWALIGETRGGKGTLIKLLGALVGTTNLVSVSFNDWNRGKAAQNLLGRTVIALPDVRLPPATRWRAGGLDHDSVELALRITAGDEVSIPQMYDQAWKGILAAKMILASNKVPNFNDLILSDRFIKQAHNQSFKDREDVTLLGRLKAELPGIAVKAMKAYWAACERGRVIQPKSGLGLKADIEDEANPFSRFVREKFVIDPKGVVLTDDVWFHFRGWCEDNGMDDLLASVMRNNILKRFKELPGLSRITRVRLKRIYYYTLLRWRKKADGDSAD
jgi:putative DNA primase/helicase